MFYVIFLFSFISVVFLCPKYRWILLGHIKSKTKEEKLCVLFGKYMRNIAVIMFLLWVTEYFCIGCAYILATILLIIASLNFALRLHLE